MANHVGFEGANTIYQAPKGAKDVGDLECLKTDSEVISCWRLSEEEIAQIVETGVVWLSIKGHTVAPVYVSGHSLVIDPQKQNLSYLKEKGAINETPIL